MPDLTTADLVDPDLQGAARTLEACAVPAAEARRRAASRNQLRHPPALR
jgi:hypothetical protein